MAIKVLTREERIEILTERDGPDCFLCGEPFVSQEDVTFDHWVPQSRGGTWEISNLRLMHKRCNALKGDTMPVDDKTVIINKRESTFRTKAVKRTQRPDLCQRCENGRSLGPDEYCDSCGSVPMPFKHPQWAKLKPNDCEHGGIWWCWCCMSGIIDRQPAILDVLGADDDSEFDM